ncbi:ImuA family protein [Limoniibacter endophyticus]|uniref:Protein ImuA n=1 Tax=Limoniibacter endophyticus TaxID=1565040 RepID=A0A8J3DG56_9HYPH|nr:ImuA family protein [Limoniibacter endophyticus]GHC62518.1 hypothetical protein GCM10010136_03660 [Limoniibacter endophyticus]
MTISRAHVMADLRQRLASLEREGKRKVGSLPFGVREVDAVLPGGGLSYGALHEFAGNQDGATDGAAAALFAAGIAARTKGPIVWCLTRPDLFFPALAQAGLHPSRVTFIESDREEDVLANMEEGLSYGRIGAVVGEIVRLPMTASRRLQLAAEKKGNLALAVRRWGRMADADDFSQPTASATKWRISLLPSAPLPVPGVGRAQWFLELVRAKAGEPAAFVVGACDDKGCIDILSRSGYGQDKTARSLHWR